VSHPNIVAICFKKTLLSVGFDRVLPPGCLSSRDPFRLSREDYILQRMRQVLCDVIESRSGFCLWLYSLRKVGLRRRHFPLVSILCIFLVVDKLERPFVLLFRFLTVQNTSGFAIVWQSC